MCLRQIATVKIHRMTKSNLPQLLNRKEVAAWLGCSVRSVINYEKQGILKPYKVGNAVRYRVDELLLEKFPQPRRK